MGLFAERPEPPVRAGHQFATRILGEHGEARSGEGIPDGCRRHAQPAHPKQQRGGTSQSEGLDGFGHPFWRCGHTSPVTTGEMELGEDLVEKPRLRHALRASRPGFWTNPMIVGQNRSGASIHVK